MIENLFNSVPQKIIECTIHRTYTIYVQALVLRREQKDTYKGENATRKGSLDFFHEPIKPISIQKQTVQYMDIFSL